MRILHSSACLTLAVTIAISLANVREVCAQPQFDVNAGLWVPFLPEYKAGSLVNGAAPILTDIFQDNQSDVGLQLGISGQYHFAPTRTSIESEWNFAHIGSMGSNARFDDPGPGGSVWFATLDGNNSIASANGGGATFAFDSDVFHFSRYLGLRDRFNLQRFGLGTLDIGAGFSMMEFQQDFLLTASYDSGLLGSYHEDLDTSYLGGEVRATFTKWIGNNRILFDAAFGVFDMDAEYGGTSILRNGGVTFDTTRVATGIRDTATTVDLGMRLDTMVGNTWIRPALSLKYISDMAAINHPQTDVAAPPVFLTTDKAFVLGANLEFVF